METSSESGSQQQLEASVDQSPQLDATAVVISGQVVEKQPTISLAGFHTFFVVGNQRDPMFQKAKSIAQDLAATYRKYAGARIKVLTPFEWEIFVPENTSVQYPLTVSQGVRVGYQFDPKARPVDDETPADIVTEQGMYTYRQELKRKKMTPLSSPVASANSEFKVIGNTEDFVKYAGKKFGYVDQRTAEAYVVQANEEWIAWLKSTQHTFVKLSIHIDGQSSGDLTLELFDDVVPKTCDNFKQLAQGSFKSEKGQVLAYAGTSFHRLVHDGWLQGGDVHNQDGMCGESIYGQTFEDENFVVPHIHRGMLSMSNRGPHTNNSQFFISFKGISAFDKNFVAFGRVVDGEKTLKALEQVKTVYPERPSKECKIAACEVLAL